MGFGKILRNAVVMEHFDPYSCFHDAWEAVCHASIAHLLGLNRISKMCSLAFVRTNLNQENEYVYIK